MKLHHTKSDLQGKTATSLFFMSIVMMTGIATGNMERSTGNVARSSDQYLRMGLLTFSESLDNIWMNHF